MKFKDFEHKIFYEEKISELNKLRNINIYEKSVIYVLAMCKTTRDNFSNIFDLKNGTININSIRATYQTGTSVKVTRMAFSLWNGCNYDSEDEIENNIVSLNYNVSEIFSCIYAPYFWEAIKIRYPDYTKIEKIELNLV